MDVAASLQPATDVPLHSHAGCIQTLGAQPFEKSHLASTEQDLGLSKLEPVWLLKKVYVHLHINSIKFTLHW